jgi:DNA-binding transcriptional MerR regulator
VATEAKYYRVSQVARLARVSVRTLHHYDEIGLLVPSSRTPSGYRLYTDADLRRLHQILLFRELGFTLESIGQALDDPAFDRRKALRAQRDLLLERIRRTESVVRAVDRALEALEGGREMETGELFEGFEDFDHARYEAEVRERWGETDAYRESLRRTKSYTKEDWARIKAEGEEVVTRLAELKAAGRRPDDDEVVEAVERYRLHLDRWFYPVSREMHVRLAELYEADPRYGEYFEQRGEGLTAFVAAAIRANAGRAEA